MAAATIHVDVVSAEEAIFSGEAEFVVLPGEVGYLGILYNHAPLVTTLKPGTLTWRTPGGEPHERLIGDGLMEIARNRLTILTSFVKGASSTHD